MAAAGRLRNKRLTNHKAKVDRLQNEREEEERKEMETWFENHDVDNDNKFDSEELKSLFHHIEPTFALSEEAGKFLLDKISSVEEINKENVMEIVRKYRHYAKQWDKLNELFTKYDKNRNGILEKNEIRSLMIDKARGVMNVSQTVTVTEEDVDYVMRLANPNYKKEGGISREQLMTAVSQWYHLASLKRKKMREKTSFCDIL
eukprot:g3852.t1